jgi:hypothetical protein
MAAFFHRGFVGLLQEHPAMRSTLLALACMSLLGLTGCGTRPGERALSGGAIGAAGGAGIAAIAGGPVLGAALLGGAAGALAGVVTAPRR